MMFADCIPALRERMGTLHDESRIVILIVDDCADVAGAMKRLLQHRGFVVECIGDGISALEAMKGELPELVVMDCHMPGMSGLELFYRMKEDSKLREAPVIFFSAEGKGPTQREATEIGAMDWVVKDGQGWKRILEVAEEVRRGKSAVRKIAEGENMGAGELPA